MRIECPYCGASYEVPAEKVAPGRAVKCARCGERWQPVDPVEPVRAPAPVASVEPEEVAWPGDMLVDAAEPEPVAPAMTEPPTPDEAEPAPTPALSPARRGDKRVAAAWIATVLVIAAAAWALATHRTAMVRAWPPIERLYVGLSLH